MNSSKKPFWLHCNICGNLEGGKYKMTNCGTILCDSEKCLGLVTTRRCKECQGPCKRLIDLDAAPEEVMLVFQPISAQISSLEQTMSFQEKQATDFLQSQRQQLDRQGQAVNNVCVQREEVSRRMREAEQDFEQFDRKEAHLEQRKENLLVERRKLEEEGRERERLRREIKFHEEQQRRKELELQRRRPRPSSPLSQYGQPRENLDQFQGRYGAASTADFTSLSGIEPFSSRVRQVQTGPWKTDRTTLSTPNKGIGRNFEREPSLAMRDLEDLSRRPSNETLDTASKFSFASRFFTRKSY